MTQCIKKGRSYTPTSIPAISSSWSIWTVMMNVHKIRHTTEANWPQNPKEKIFIIYHHLFSFVKHEFHQFTYALFAWNPHSVSFCLLRQALLDALLKLGTTLDCSVSSSFAVLGLPCCRLCQWLGECPWKWLVMISASPAPLMACREASPLTFTQHWKLKEGWETFLKAQSDLERARAWFGH